MSQLNFPVTLLFHVIPPIFLPLIMSQNNLPVTRLFPFLFPFSSPCLPVTILPSCNSYVFYHSSPFFFLSSCFYPFLFYLSSHLFLSVVSIIFKYCFVTFCHLSPFLLTRPPSPFHQRYIPSHRFACLTPGFLLRTLIIGVMQWCLLLQSLQISWLNSW